MSLIIYYRGCFSADTKIKSSNGSTNVYSRRSKTFLSEDKLFAGMSSGKILDPSEWMAVKDSVEKFRLSREHDPSISYTDLSNELLKIASGVIEGGQLIIASGDLFINFQHNNKFGLIADLDIDEPYVGGSGYTAANVLILSNIMIDQKEFFNIVSHCDSDVSAEYTFIELKDVIDTPWFKK